jgi:para-aminobenzoate synthetase component 1
VLNSPPGFSVDGHGLRIAAFPSEPDRHVREVGRFEWRLGDGGDPLGLLAAFLADAGLGLAGRARAGVDGAALMISAAAGAVAVGGPAGAPTPCPEVPDVVAVLHAWTDRAPAPDPGAPWHCGPWRTSWSPEEHAAAVERVRAAIARGEVYQANVVGHRSAPCSGDPAAALRAVSGLPGAVYGGVLTGDGWAVASGSPECLVTVSEGRVETRPIKGTRPRTAVGRAELLASAKERAEHVMIVDLERNDLSRVARTGSVRVEELFTLREWCDLWQAESVVAADLSGGADLLAVLRALCPGGSVTGAPKSSALRLVAELEPVGRGPAMGALGYLTPGRLDLGLTIRTIAIAGGRAHLWTGGGITWGSEAWAEVAEAEAKAAPVLAALAAAATG